MKRRNFFRSIALGGVGAALTPVAKAASSLASEKMKPKTNVKQALAIPRNEYSMPGKYPGKSSQDVIPPIVSWMVNHLRP